MCEAAHIPATRGLEMQGLEMPAQDGLTTRTGVTDAAMLGFQNARTQGFRCPPVPHFVWKLAQSIEK